MMSAPFRQQINKESGMLRVIKSRYGLAAHDVVCVALLTAHSVDAVDARAGAYNIVSHCSAPEK
jgi:PIN domain nuclease of toxin-antitoxin system